MQDPLTTEVQLLMKYGLNIHILYIILFSFFGLCVDSNSILPREHNILSKYWLDNYLINVITLIAITV